MAERIKLHGTLCDRDYVLKRDTKESNNGSSYTYYAMWPHGDGPQKADTEIVLRAMELPLLELSYA